MIRIGTRGSKLALWQANHLKMKLDEIGLDSKIVIIQTKGDRVQHLSFDKIEGKGFFTKEIEEALVSKEIDVAVHSLKDLPTEMEDGLALAGLSERANPADLLITRPDVVLSERPLQLKSDIRIGTSSIRRKIQIKQIFQRIELVDIRGNVPTRIEKLEKGLVDGILLAAAGIERLNIDLSHLFTLQFNPIEFIPAPGQGVNAYQCRTKDTIHRKIIQRIHHREVATCTNVERKILKLLDGGCQLPLGAYCYRDSNGYFHCYAALGSELSKGMKFYNYSSSTSAGIADKVVTYLLNESIEA